MRVYVPGTWSVLPTLLSSRALPAGPGFAVTPALREAYAAGDAEELEYASLQRAAHASLALLSDEVTAVRRRVVVVAEVPDGGFRVASHDDPDADPAAVDILAAVPLSAVAAVHVDDRSAVPLVRAALITPEDEDTMDDLEAAGLLWYASQEIDTLLAEG